MVPMADQVRPEQIRVIIQMRTTPALAVAAFGGIEAAPALGITEPSGVELDATYSPVPVPPRPSTETSAEPGFGIASSFSATEPPTHVVRAAVQVDAWSDFLERANNDDNVVGVFGDPAIAAFESHAVCPTGPVGTDLDVERLLLVEELHRRGMNGAGVPVVIVDSGVSLPYLRRRGKMPEFSAELSWGPVTGQPLGDMPVDHGTMCAYDVCIAAPSCTLIDHALLTSTTSGGSVMDGYLSDAVKSYGVLLSYMSRAPEPGFGGPLPRTLVVNNSWGMFHPSWDFPVGNPQNYSDNPDHPFTIIVESLEAAGADILFATGNCGPECADPRCQRATDVGIYGANSSSVVTSVAGVVISKERIGYSTKGPGRLEERKPDIASYTHFAGSGVFQEDSGTSAATPVAAGVVAAIRRRYPASVLPPRQLRDLLRDTAEPQGDDDFDFEYGHGIIDVQNLLESLEQV
jgi:subtilisin family serine protease